MNILTIYESLLEKEEIPASYENKTKIPRKSNKFPVLLQGEARCVNSAQAIWTWFLAELINSFLPNVSILYPLKTPENQGIK